MKNSFNVFNAIRIILGNALTVLDFISVFLHKIQMALILTLCFSSLKNICTEHNLIVYDQLNRIQDN